MINQSWIANRNLDDSTGKMCTQEHTCDEDRKVNYRWMKNEFDDERISIPYDQLDRLKIMIPNDPISRVLVFIKYKKGRNGKFGLLDVKHAISVICTNGPDSYLTDRVDFGILLKRMPKEELSPYLNSRCYLSTRSTFFNCRVNMHDLIDVLKEKRSKLVRTQCSLLNNCIMYVMDVEKGFVKKKRAAAVQEHRIKKFRIRNIPTTEEDFRFLKLKEAEDLAINSFWESLMAED